MSWRSLAIAATVGVVVSLLISIICFSVAAILLVTGAYAQEERHCDLYRITGYVRGAGSGWTYDGTSEYTREDIVAVSWNVPIDAKVEVVGLGTFRAADRGGGLERRHVDVLVDSASTARQLTSYREACWWLE